MLDWLTKKVVLLDEWNVKVIDFRKDVRKRSCIYNSIMTLMDMSYLKKEDQYNVYLKRTYTNDGTKWLKWEDLQSGVNDGGE